MECKGELAGNRFGEVEQKSIGLVSGERVMRS